MNRTTESLAQYTWLKIGGPADIVIPENKKELISILNECSTSGESYRILGNGSNVLISDKGIDDLVIINTDACSRLEIEGRNVYAGGSVMVPQFISSCIENNLGGYEYLYSVPGTIGGSIYMNAGRGAGHNQTISDYLKSVEVYADGKIKTMRKNELDFDHRYSSFQNYDELVILEAQFELPEQSTEVGRKKAQERMSKVQKRERSLPNAGSVFKSGARLPLHKFPPQGLSVGDARFVGPNRICNDGNASFDEVVTLINRAKLLNKIIPPFEEPEVEWKIWE